MSSKKEAIDHIRLKSTYHNDPNDLWPWPWHWHSIAEIARADRVAQSTGLG